MQTKTITVDVTVEVPDHHDDPAVLDDVKWHLHLVDFDDVALDPSPTNVVAMKQTHRPILPGDLVDRRGTDLDSREVVAVGRDWLTLDIMGTETERLPLDNYEIAVPREGRL